MSAVQPVWHLFVGTVFQNSVIPSGKTHFSLSSSDNSIISNWDAASSATKGAFKRSDSAVKGLIRKLICGLFASGCRTDPQNSDVAFLSVLHNMQFSLLQPQLHLHMASPERESAGSLSFEVESGTVSACWQKKKMQCTRSGSNFNFPCRSTLSLFRWCKMSTKNPKSDLGVT